MIGRRTFVAGSLIAAGSPAFGAKKPAPPKVGAIRWPGPGYELHGYMAVPAKAHGRQPAILVVPDTSGTDPFALGLVDALAAAGFVTCIARALASVEEASATIGWLATNTYATGKVGAIGLGWGSALIRQTAATPDSRLTCGVTFGGDQSPLQILAPVLDLPALAVSTDPAAYASAWHQALDFLAVHLR